MDCNFVKIIIFALTNAGIAQLVEHDLAKVGVASPSLVSRSDQNKEKTPVKGVFCL
jgi:hypothetical protein